MIKKYLGVEYPKHQNERKKSNIKILEISQMHYLSIKRDLSKTFLALANIESTL